MDFQQKMMEYAKYGISVRTSSSEGVDYYMVTLTFGSKWQVDTSAQTNSGLVMCAKIKNDGTYCYMTEVSNGINPVFELIDKTIQYNEELEKKVELLKVKAEELKELFATKPYYELVNLKFIIGDTVKYDASTKAKKEKKRITKSVEKKETPNTKVETVVKEDSTVHSVSEVQAQTTVQSDIDRKIQEAIGK